MRRFISLYLAFMMVIGLCACAGNVRSGTDSTSAETQDAEAPAQSVEENPEESVTEPEETAEQTASNTNILVVYFSRTGEQYTVGTIDKGNTAIVAEMIAEKTGADLYEILPETDYPYTYSALTDIAKQEQSENARPAIRDELPDLSRYDTVFIGAPVWWGDWPMIMYTFFENADLSGKNLVPFSTHEGSGLSGFDRKLAAAVPNATVLTGQAFQGNDCQNKQTDVRNAVDRWIVELGY